MNSFEKRMSKFVCNSKIIVNNNLIGKQQKMHVKQKKYSQMLCEMSKQNKQNRYEKQQKNKPVSLKDITVGYHHGNKNFHLLPFNQNKKSDFLNSYSLNQKMPALTKHQSKRYLRPKPTKYVKQYQINQREKSIKLPKISKEQFFQPGLLKRKHTNSYKKIRSQPTYCESQIDSKTLSPKQNIKQLLINIVKSKENRHLASIDEQIEKLETLTKRYSCLRKDLVSIQEDILTIIFKQKYKQKSSQTSSSRSVIVM